MNVQTMMDTGKNEAHEQYRDRRGVPRRPYALGIAPRLPVRPPRGR